MRDHTQSTSSIFARKASLATTAVGTAALLLLWGAGTASGAVEPVSLGTADSFVVLAGAGVTATGPNTLNGDIGTFPTTSITGAGTITVNGTDHGGDGVTQQAKTDLTTAYGNASGQGPTSPIVADLAGQTLTAGIYNSGSQILLTGALTLDAAGDPNALFVFQAGSDLIVGPGASVNLINDAQACNVFWQVTSSASLDSNASFRGSILALTTITLNTGATVEGRVLASNGTVTLDTNTITAPICTRATRPEVTPVAPEVTPVAPEVTPVGGIQTGDGSMAAHSTGLDMRLAVGGTVGLLAAAVVFAVFTRRRLRTV